jgi:hypothetical protein
MKAVKPLLLLLMMFSLLACNLAAVPLTVDSPAATSAAQTQAAAQPFPTATALPLPTAVPSIPNPGLILALPADVASGVQSENLPEASGADIPFWNVHPAYTRHTLAGYPLQGTSMQPQIHVYPVEAFAHISPGAAETIDNLKALLTSQPIPASLPFLPLVNASQVFHSNFARLTFQNGIGIRYLTQFDQAILPVNNQELIYTFQGFTNDGRYYVAAVLPINAGFLSVDANPQSPLPPDGIPFDWNDFQSMPVYLQKVVQRLESVPVETFVPNLSSLDQMISSLRVDLP